MADIKIPVVELAKDKFQLSIDTNLYAKEVITAAIYKFSHLFYVHQQTDASNPAFVTVIFESKDNVESTSKCKITIFFCRTHFWAFQN